MGSRAAGRPPSHGAQRAGLLAVLVAALALSLVLPATPARARPAGKPITLGMGVAATRAAGGLDGQRVVTESGGSGLTSYLGKLDNGHGSLLMGGMTLTPSMALELLLLSTRHDARHESLPGETLPAHVGSLLGTVRLMLPLSEDFELFGRLGAGPVIVRYSDNTRLPPTSARFGAALSGLSIAAGGGVAMFFDPLGLELAVLQQRARLSEISAASNTMPSFRDTYINLGSVTLILTMHFGVQ